MTDQELKELVASLAIAQRETDHQIKELRLSQQETDRLLKETDHQIKELRLSQQETDRLLKETDHQIKELRLSQQETDRRQKEASRMIKELGKQIGGLGEKFGSFTEGMALPSMEKVLRQKFGMEWVSPRVRYSKGGESIEIDVLAHANGEINTAYLVEAKSHAREEAIDQLQAMLARFRWFYPEHGGKKLHGLLAAVDFSLGVKERALREGFYVARIRDDVFELDTPKGFQPKAY